MISSVGVSISEESQVGEARRTAVTLACHLGCDETQTGEIAIIVTEAARNILRHAGSGEVLLSTFDDTEEGLEILALDKGPGIDDISRCFDDGFSTSSTPGTGLGAIRRLSSAFDIYSQPGAGTALLMRYGGRNQSSRQISESTLSCRCGVTMLPKPREEFCGDGWCAARTGETHKFMVCDGLGHGPQAAVAADEAIRTFQNEPQRAPGQILQSAHAALKMTRGAAMAVAEVDTKNGQLRFAGIGNISASIHNAAGSTNMVSHNGIVGAEMRKVQEFCYPWPQDAILIMHSDGLASQWQLGDYPGLLIKHPSLMAGVLYRDHTRGRDDVTVLAVSFSE